MRTRPLLAIVAGLSVTFLLAAPSYTQPLVTIDTVTVGDAGNAAHSTGWGAVADVFAMGKYEVTIGQYTTFLNSVASVPPLLGNNHILHLWNDAMSTDNNSAGISRSGSGTLDDPYSYSVMGSGNRPVTHVNWFDAARFANWMNNGATLGASTETGAYPLNGARSGIVTVNPGATWFLPSEDQWYKAAFYKGGGTDAGYWRYPTQSDSRPGNTIGGAANQANHYIAGSYAVTQYPFLDEQQNYLTEVGAYSASASAYGTFDQAGNVSEWNDAVFGSDERGRRGGSWTIDGVHMTSDRFGRDSDYRVMRARDRGSNVGFRLASVPEPSTYALLAMTAAGGLWMARRRR